MALAAWQAAPVAPQQHGCCTACSAQRRVLQRWLRQPRRGARCSMEVPSDSFGGQSPERKAATALRTLFTFCAVKIVLSQLSGSGRGGLASYNSKQYDALTTFLEEEPLRDGDAWLKGLLARDEMLALRVMEVRQAYAAESFEWDQLQRLAIGTGQDANVKLLRGRAEESFLRQGAADERKGGA